MNKDHIHHLKPNMALDRLFCQDEGCDYVSKRDTTMVSYYQQAVADMFHERRLGRKWAEQADVLQARVAALEESLAKEAVRIYKEYGERNKALEAKVKKLESKEDR